MANKDENEVDSTEETEEISEDVVDETEDDSVNESQDDTDDESDDEETVSRKDLDAVKKALGASRNENKEKDKQIRTLKRQLREAQAKKPDDVDSQKLVEEAKKETSRFRDIAVRKEAEIALRDAGAKVSTSRLIKLLDLSDVEFNDNGKIDGLDDAVEDLKDESPEFFRSEEDEEETKPSRKPGKIDGGSKKTPSQKPQGVAQQMLKSSGLRLAKSNTIQ